MPGWVRSPYAPLRRPTFAVGVGDVLVGGSNPIRVQSMTTTDTLDTRGTVDQIERLADAAAAVAPVAASSEGVVAAAGGRRTGDGDGGHVNSTCCKQ